MSISRPGSTRVRLDCGCVYTVKGRIKGEYGCMAPNRDSIFELLEKIQKLEALLKAARTF